MPDSQKDPQKFTAKEAFSPEFDPETRSQPQASSSNKKEAQETLKKTLDYIKQALPAKGFSKDLPISIYDGKTLIYKAEAGKEPTKNLMTPEKAALLQKTLENPQGLQGSIRIRVGSEKVFHVLDGQIVTDKLGLVAERPSQQQAPQAAVAQENLTAEQRIEMLEKAVQQQQQQIAHLSKQLEKLSRPLPQVAYSKLNTWFKSTQAQIQKTGQSLVEKLSQSLQQNKETLMNQVREFITNNQERVAQTQERVLTQMEATRNQVEIKAGEFALGAMTAATQKVAHLVSEPVAVSPKQSLDPSQAWQQYTQKVQQAHLQEGEKNIVPAQITVSAAQYALTDGHSKRSVLQMIKSDPEYQRINSAQGPKKATQYADLALAKATRLIQQNSSKPQAQKQATAQSTKAPDEPGF